jgi:hypothetical protein
MYFIMAYIMDFRDDEMDLYDHKFYDHRTTADKKERCHNDNKKY